MSGTRGSGCWFEKLFLFVGRRVETAVVRKACPASERRRRRRELPRRVAAAAVLGALASLASRRCRMPNWRRSSWRRVEWCGTSACVGRRPPPRSVASRWPRRRRRRGSPSTRSRSSRTSHGSRSGPLRRWQPIRAGRRRAASTWRRRRAASTWRRRMRRRRRQPLPVGGHRLRLRAAVARWRRRRPTSAVCVASPPSAVGRRRTLARVDWATPRCRLCPLATARPSPPPICAASRWSARLGRPLGHPSTTLRNARRRRRWRKAPRFAAVRSNASSVDELWLTMVSPWLAHPAMRQKWVSFTHFLWPSWGYWGIAKDYAKKKCGFIFVNLRISAA